MRGRRRQRKRRLKREFAFYQTSSQLFQITYFVKYMDLNPDEPYPSSERERKFPRFLFTSSVKRDIRHFQVVVVQ